MSGHRFAGKAALVTGAARGIGAAIASALAAEGAAVAALDLIDAGEDGAGAMTASVRADVSRAAQLGPAVDEAAAALGGLDLLVNVAGVVGYAAAPDCDEAEWDRVMDTNAKGSFFCAKHAIPHMRKRGGGAIVNTSSVMAFATAPTAAVYSASKAAIAAMTRAMALDHAHEGIRVNCLVPGVIRTPLVRAAVDALGLDDPEAAVEELGRRHPIGRMIEPDEVARVALFLLSDDAAAVTGSAYPVDGGLLSRLG